MLPVRDGMSILPLKDQQHQNFQFLVPLFLFFVLIESFAKNKTNSILGKKPKIYIGIWNNHLFDVLGKSAGVSKAKNGHAELETGSK